MKKILFVIKNYYPALSASGHVLNLLINAAKSDDVLIGVICMNSRSDGYEEVREKNIIVYKYDNLPQSKVSAIFNKFTKQVDTRLYSKQVRKVACAIEYMIEKYNFNCLIPITVDEIYASLLIKNKFRKIKLIPYLFEKIPTYDSFYIFNRMRRNNEEILKNRILLESSKIIIFPTLNNYFSNREKIVITDHPMIVNNTLNANIKDKCVTSVSYVGGLDRRIRNPSKVLEIISVLLSNRRIQPLNIHFDFYGYGNCDYILNSFQKNFGDYFKYHGSVDNDTASKIMRESDFLITIGNFNSPLVPSKVFDCISTGRPIIHFYFETDSYIEILKKYPCAICLDLNDSSDNNADRLSDFLTETVGKHVPFDYIKNAYEECTPEFVFNQIIDACYSD